MIEVTENLSILIMDIPRIGSNMKHLTAILAAGLVLFAFAYLFILGDANKAFLMAILASNIFVLMKLEKPNINPILEALVPAICQRCAAGHELVVEVPLVEGSMGDYAHREVKGGWLQSCRAHAIHCLLDTPAEQIQPED